MYTVEELEKIATPGAEFISRELAQELLDAPSGSRPRIYAIEVDGPQILRIQSNYYLDLCGPLDALWVVQTRTVADLIGRA